MRSFPASSRRAGRLVGAAGMLFLSTFAISVQKIRLLALDLDGTLLNGAKQITPRTQAALERARVAAVQSGSSESSRYFFDYPRARADLETIRDGIDRYLTPSRAQPRTTSAVNGHYRRERP